MALVITAVVLALPIGPWLLWQLGRRIGLWSTGWTWVHARDARKRRTMAERCRLALIGARARKASPARGLLIGGG
jgi:hypothetical protein